MAPDTAQRGDGSGRPYDRLNSNGFTIIPVDARTSPLTVYLRRQNGAAVATDVYGALAPRGCRRAAAYAAKAAAIAAAAEKQAKAAKTARRKDRAAPRCRRGRVVRDARLDPGPSGSPVQTRRQRRQASRHERALRSAAAARQAVTLMRAGAADAAALTRGQPLRHARNAAATRAAASTRTAGNASRQPVTGAAAAMPRRWRMPGPGPPPPSQALAFDAFIAASWAAVVRKVTELPWMIEADALQAAARRKEARRDRRRRALTAAAAAPQLATTVATGMGPSRARCRVRRPVSLSHRPSAVGDLNRSLPASRMWIYKYRSAWVAGRRRHRLAQLHARIRCNKRAYADARFKEYMAAKEAE